MNIRALKTLLEIARIGSFATAANQMNMTLSAVSMQMKSLENELGVTLFDRSTRPPRLTSVGRLVCDHAQKLVKAEAELIETCRPSDRLTGIFRIGFVATASVRLLPGFLTRSRKLAPNAQFDIETGLSEVLETRVLTGQLDVAVVTASPNPNPGLSYRLLREERLVYVAPSGFSALSADELFRQLPFIHFLPESGIGKLIATHVNSFNRHANRGIVLDSVEAIMECVNLGLGFTLLPEPDIQRHIGRQARIVESGAVGLARRLVLVISAKASIRSQVGVIESLFAHEVDVPVALDASSR